MAGLHSGSSPKCSFPSYNMTASHRTHNHTSWRERELHSEALGIGDIIARVFVHAKENVAQVIVFRHGIQSRQSGVCDCSLPGRRASIPQHVEDAMDVGFRGEIHTRVHRSTVSRAFLGVPLVRLIAAHLLQVVGLLDELAARTKRRDSQILRMMKLVFSSLPHRS